MESIFLCSNVPPDRPHTNTTLSCLVLANRVRWVGQHDRHPGLCTLILSTDPSHSQRTSPGWHAGGRGAWCRGDLLPEMIQHWPAPANQPLNKDPEGAQPPPAEPGSKQQDFTPHPPRRIINADGVTEGGGEGGLAYTLVAPVHCCAFGIQRTDLSPRASTPG